MAKCVVLQIDTPAGEAALRAKARKVRRMDDDLRALARDLAETLVDDPLGAARAAPQIGVSVCMVAFNIPPGAGGEDDPGLQTVLYNPRIIRRRGGRHTAEEGCLSLRHRYGSVERDWAVVVAAYDLSHRALHIDATGYIARCLQHEIDHLDGIMFTDRMANPARDLQYVDRETEAAEANAGTGHEGA